MMGQHSRSESLFYYFRIEDQVPENHLLRLIDRHVSFDFVREKLKDSYSDTGRPSIDPELLLRILLIGYLYGVTSERKLIEELRMHLAWRRTHARPKDVFPAELLLVVGAFLLALFLRGLLGGVLAGVIAEQRGGAEDQGQAEH